jgi:DNA-binding response OmpR family regulator
MARILSLNAEQEILGLLTIILKRAGYEHLTATNSDEALKILREQDIDLFMHNIIRNDGNSCEFYNTMQSEQNLKNIPTLILSSLEPSNLPEPCTQLLAQLYPQYYITLPFSPKKLLKKIQSILGA